MNERSWEEASSWYKDLVGSEGHYYHKSLILPDLLRFFKRESVTSLLDLGCGQGVLARAIDPSIDYWGVDLSPSLIEAAKRETKRKSCHFVVGDVTRKIDVAKRDFDCATLVLALQDIDDAAGALKIASRHLKVGGHLVIVLNHPCFRIPRQTMWGVDEGQKLQYRRINLYMTPREIPIQTNPGKSASPVVTSYHRPLELYSRYLFESGLAIQEIKELVSDKVSTGKKAVMEDRARAEFPLFLVLVCVKMAGETAVKPAS